MAEPLGLESRTVRVVPYDTRWPAIFRAEAARLTEAVAVNCQGWIVANGYNIKSPDVSRVYLLVRRGAPRPQCALPQP